MGMDLHTNKPTGNYTNISSEDLWRAQYDNCDYDRWNWIGWLMIWRMAIDYGWEPAGTVLELCLTDDPEEEAKLKREWDGDYTTNEWQTVTAEDALNLAAALEKALVDIPDNDDIQPEVMISLRIAGRQQILMTVFFKHFLSWD